MNVQKVALLDNTTDNEDESEDDCEAEAEEMARRLQEQLREDIERAQQEIRAQMDAAAPRANPSHAAPCADSSHTAQATVPSHSDESVAALEKIAHGNVAGSARDRRSAAAVLTIQAILVAAEKNSLVRSTLAASLVPGDGSPTVLDVFHQCVSSRKVSKEVAARLRAAVIALAQSERLFASLRNSDAPAIQLDKGKRRWDAADGPGAQPQEPPPKRMAVDQPEGDLRYQVSDAVRTVTDALAPVAASPTPLIHPHLIAAIHLPLHQIFLFAVTSAPRAAGEQAAALQELAGLIQMLGVLSGVQLGTPAPAPAPPADIGTAVYPCASCAKVFARLFSLKAHTRAHLLVDRPFRCTRCVARFARSHDLKRHARLHGPRAHRCGGCGKLFSRRDALKRHQDNRRAGAGTGAAAEGACAHAPVEEVEVERPDGEEDALRRAKMWDGIAASAGAGPPAGYLGQPPPDDVPEEGEMDPAVVLEAQAIALGLHPLLHGYVTKVLGHAPVLPNPVGVPNPLVAAPQATFARPPSSAGGSSQPTLVSVIADANGGNGGASGRAGQATGRADAPTASAVLSNALALSEEQTRLLEQAIAQAALAALAQAEAEAALEEEDEGTDDEDDEIDDR